MDTAERMVEFYDGVHALQRIAGWADVVADPRRFGECLASFAKAYEVLAGLHAAGKLGAGAADFSYENVARVKRICALIEPGLESGEARQAAKEILALAESCLKGLALPDGSPHDPGTP